MPSDGDRPAPERSHPDRLVIEHGLRQVADEKPPVLGTWPRVYSFVLVYLAVLILLFWWFTRYYAPPAA